MTDCNWVTESKVFVESKDTHSKTKEIRIKHKF